MLFPTVVARAGAAGSSRAVYGAILRIDQLEKCLIPALHSDPASFLRRLADQGWTFVHLKRRNALLQALSNLVAHEHQRWHLQEGQDSRTKKVRINCERLVEWTRWNERVWEDEESILATLPHLSLTYEDDLLPSTRHQTTANRAFHFLEVSTHPVRAPLRRSGAGGLEERVRNHAEVIAHVRSAGFEHYLEAGHPTSPTVEVREDGRMDARGGLSP